MTTCSYFGKYTTKMMTRYLGHKKIEIIHPTFRRIRDLMHSALHALFPQPKTPFLIAQQLLYFTRIILQRKGYTRTKIKLLFYA